MLTSGSMWRGRSRIQSCSIPVILCSDRTPARKQVHLALNVVESCKAVPRLERKTYLDLSTFIHTLTTMPESPFKHNKKSISQITLQWPRSTQTFLRNMFSIIQEHFTQYVLKFHCGSETTMNDERTQNSITHWHTCESNIIVICWMYLTEGWYCF